MSKPHSTTPEKKHESIEQKLDRIAEYLRRLDRRDRIRTSWMAVRSILGMIPLLIIIGSAVYLYWQRGVIFQQFASALAKQLHIQGLLTGPLLRQLEQLLQ